jgi:hypothetical protein
MKRKILIQLIPAFLVLMVFSLESIKAGGNMGTIFSKDTITYKQVEGLLIDKLTGKPLVFANLQVKNTKLGTVTNADGEFVLKIPSKYQDQSLIITHIGYKDLNIPLSELDKTGNELEVIPEAIPIEELTFRNLEPVELLAEALKRVPENYLAKPANYTSFYREAIKQNRHYVSIGEAVLKAYKSPYDKEFVSDRVKIFKGRKSRDVKKMDTVVVKLEGGPYTAYMLDIVKNPHHLFPFKFSEVYNFEVAGQVTYHDRMCYAVDFDQKENVKVPLYAGRIYITSDSLAIAGIEFSLSETGLKHAGGMLVRKKPASMRIETLGANYLVNYKEQDGKWYLSYVRTELNFKSKWKKELFFSRYMVMNEMAVTDIDTDDVTKYPRSELTRINDVFAEEIDDFMDDKFWGEYNYIKPDENIESAIARLKRRLD